MFEWGLNWCIATSAHRYLMLHAGTVAFGESGMILPGHPGFGQEHPVGRTPPAWCAPAVRRVRAGATGDPSICCRCRAAIPLKNASIEAILEFDPCCAPWARPIPRPARVGCVICGPTAQSLRSPAGAGSPRWLVFPKYQAGAEETIRPLDKTEAFRQLAFNCFNYRLLGETSFRAVAQMVRQVDCYTFTFSSLDRARRWRS